MFASGEQGAWYDPSDMSTLFQDSAGTVPVTAVEQPVGRILDKSGRGNHATQATTTKRPVLSRLVNLLNNSSASGFANYDVNVTLGAAQGPDGSMSAALISPVASSLAQFSQSVTAGDGDYTSFVIVKKKDFRYVKFLFGHATISIFDLDAGVFLSALTGYFSQALGNGWYLVGATQSMVGGWTIGYQFSSTTETGSYFNYPDRNRQVVPDADGIKGNYFAGASLTLAADAHLPYQYVNTASDYDADPAKFPAYLSFDGVDDALQTGNIDFTSTDKMTVWAGYAKINDGPTSVFLEAGSDYTGGGGIGAFSSNGGSAAFGFAHSDATGNQALNLVSAATEIGLITSRYDLQSGAQTSARKNSGAWGFASASGGGFLGNRPLYIGARAGSSYYFNGRLYGLLVRGAQSTLSQIEAAELYMKKKARIA